MRLSEAIRLGGALHPQGRQKLFITETRTFFGFGGFPLLESEVLVATCALGGALEAIGIAEVSTEEDEEGNSDIWLSSIHGVPKEWITVLDSLVVECRDANKRLPFYPDINQTVQEAIEFLNDSDVTHWTREQIADWVERVEDEIALEPASQPLTSSMRINPKEDPLLVPASSIA